MCRIGLPNKAFPHVLRHTRATHLLLEGVSVFIVGKLLGDSAATIEKNYAHATTGDVADAIEGKGARLDPLEE
jgi:site-specific recombinase XerD